MCFVNYHNIKPNKLNIYSVKIKKSVFSRTENGFNINFLLIKLQLNQQIAHRIDLQ